jgi:predicted SnoaL-like aldol condensation-catalyzing enzyme
MKVEIQTKFLFAALVIIGLNSVIQAQNGTTQKLSYKEVVVENPNAESDMKVVSDYTNALVLGDVVKAKSLLSDKYLGYGPSVKDSSNAEQRIAAWTENYKRQKDRKTSFVTQSFRVLSGNLKGNWVSLWGDYVFTMEDKTLTLPYQYTANVIDGKITSDRIYYDALSLYFQLGYKLTPPDPTAKK